MTAHQLSLVDDTEVEIERLPGASAPTVVVLITPTTTGAVVRAPGSVENFSVTNLDDDFVEVTLVLRRRIARS